jgi:hypothetical protein
MLLSRCANTDAKVSTCSFLFRRADFRHILRRVAVIATLLLPSKLNLTLFPVSVFRDGR